MALPDETMFAFAIDTGSRGIAAFERSGAPLAEALIALRARDVIASSLAYSHKVLRASKNTADPGWDTLILVIMGEADSADAASSLIETVRVAVGEAPDARLRRIDRFEVQKGIDMLHPPRGRGPRTMMHFIEYVVSHLETRDDYYRSQYDVSGPAVRELYRRGLISRFFGIERREVIAADAEVMDCDVIHLSAQTLWQFVRLPFSLRGAFDRQARKTGWGSAKALFAGWQTQRRKTIRRGKPIAALTLAPIRGRWLMTGTARFCGEPEARSIVDDETPSSKRSDGSDAL